VDIAAAIAHYDALLAGDGALADGSAAMLLERQPQEHLLFGERLMCYALRPQLLDAARFAEIDRVCGALAGAIKRLEPVLLGDERLLDLLDLDPRERRLVAVDPGYPDAAAITRLDSFVTEDSFRFVEYNAESPAGIAYDHTLGEIFRELPVMRAFERRYAIRPVSAMDSLHRTLLDSYGQWGGRGMPRVAIVDWEGLPTASEFELVRQSLERQGLPTTIVDPRALIFQGGRLIAGGQPVDLVYRRVLTHELLARLDEAPALVQAYEAGAVCVVNAFRCKLFHKKAIFAVLSDEANAHLFSAAEREVIRRHIPWTRKVLAGYTTRDGRQIDLVETILAGRERLVLKPNDDYGGRGVVLGWEVDGAAWEAALATALAGSYVVQERVPTARLPYPVYQDGAVRTVELIADLDPYVCGTHVRGMLTRVSAVALLNVTAGMASTVPTFLIEDRDR